MATLHDRHSSKKKVAQRKKIMQAVNRGDRAAPAPQVLPPIGVWNGHFHYFPADRYKILKKTP